jgi:two-component system, NtrC family, response regulator AtoC
VAEKTIETSRLLVVSRESNLLPPLWSISESNSWQIETAVSAWDAIERIQSGPTPHLLLLDLPRGDADGQHILRWLRRIHPGLPVILLCFPEDVERNEEAVRMGAQEVLTKPLDDTQLEWAIQRNLVGHDDITTEIASEDIEQLGPDSFFVTASPVSQKLRTQVQFLAEADVPVLIQGEAGSGKDTVARLIHKLSIRSGFEFLKVNCSDMPAELLEAELFGTLFPGDSRAGAGKFERADKGTIFFDEIVEMPLSVQARLMHVLQSRIALKNGIGKGSSPDFRILAATSANIDRALSERRLREDLYYVLSAFTVQVPPLLQRRAEIAILIQHMMHRLSKQYGLPRRTISAAVLNACRNYSWPGNLKELESFVKRYLMVGEKELSLHGFRTDASRTAGPYPQRSSTAPAPTDAAPEARERAQEMNIWEVGQSKPKSLKSLIHTVKSEAERNAIGMALKKTGWNRKAAARLLQVSYRTLLYKIDQYHMTASESFLSPVPEAKLSFHGSPSKGTEKAG